MCFIDITCQILVAVGTISVAIIAIWGDGIRARFYPPKLEIRLHDPQVDLTCYSNGKPVYFYHLKVVNLRRGISARNCRIILRAIHKKAVNGQFVSLPLSIFCQFIWAPAEFTPPLISINTEDILDFGSIAKDPPCWKPALYSYPNNFQGIVRADDVVRFSLMIEAESFASDKYQVFEVAWNGKWADNVTEMSSNLIIREVMDS